MPEVGFEGFDFSAEVRIGSAGFQDIFAGVLGSKREAAREAPHRGEDLEESVRIAFDECFHPRAAACTSCASTAARPVSERASGPWAPSPAPTAADPGRCAPIAAA